MSMATQKQNVPNLRFPEFVEKWEEKRIADVLKVGSGRDYKHLGTGDIPVYGTGGYMTSVDEYLHDGESVCIGRKGTIDKPVYLNEKFWTVDTLFYTHSFKDSVPKFIYAIFQLINWKQHNEASGVPSLSKVTIEKIRIDIPKPSEQQRIASFLSSVDKKLTQLSKKKQLLEQYKKGMMQKLFSQEIRFKDDNGNDYPDWEEKKLGDVSKTTTGSSNREDSTEEGEYTFFDRSSDKRASSKYLYDCEAIIVAGEGKDFLPRYFVGKFDLHQRAYATIEFSENSGKFLYYWIYWHRSFFLKHSVGSTMPSLRMDSFAKFPVSLPDSKEQTKIANFLSTIDDKINLIETELTHAQTFKKGLLQQMFV